MYQWNTTRGKLEKPVNQETQESLVNPESIEFQQQKKSLMCLTIPPNQRPLILPVRDLGWNSKREEELAINSETEVTLLKKKLKNKKTRKRLKKFLAR